MTAAMERRLARLEARKPKAFVPHDYAAAAASLRWHLDCYAAVQAGRACRLPSPPPQPESEWSPAKLAALQLLDSIAARLAQEARG